MKTHDQSAYVNYDYNYVGYVRNFTRKTNVDGHSTDVFSFSLYYITFYVKVDNTNIIYLRKLCCHRNIYVCSNNNAQHMTTHMMWGNIAYSSTIDQIMQCYRMWGNLK